MTPPFLTSDKLGMPHGFFGRKGGVSKGMYESLNAGLGSDDEKVHVEENRTRIRAALGAEYLVSLRQVHSDRVVIATDEHLSEIEADGLVTTVPRLAIAVMGADCGMVLLSDPKAGVVGACHAGWRGALGGIIEATVATMCELGASPADINAALGPCIGPEKYEVGEEFRTEFLEMDEDYDRFFKTPKDGNPHFDLPTFILSRLDVMGVRGNWLGGCTYSQPEQYFSYRRNTHQEIEGYGRNLSAIMLA